MPQWVLLQGLTRDSRHWGPFPETLAQAFPDDRLHLLDWPGNGRYYGEASPVSIGAMVKDGRYQLSRRGLNPPFNLIGLSVGSLVATQWAVEYPGEVEAAVLINPAMQSPGPFKQRLRPESRRALRKMLFGFPSDEEREETLLRLTSRRCADDAAARTRLLAERVRWRGDMPVSRLNLLRQWFAAARYHAPAARPPARLLILASERDELVDVRSAQQLAAAWACDLALHPQAGHDLPLDDGVWVARQIQAWFTTGAVAAPHDAAELSPVA